MARGYVHVYTGNGKGKTTAALGLALRAVCAGKRVFFGQFVKGMDYSELKAVDFLPNFVIEQFGRGCFIHGKPGDEDIKAAKNGLGKLKKILEEGNFDLVVMDEVNIALYFELITSSEVIEAVNNRAEHVEVVLTGRYAPQEVIDLADLVTEMKEVKHYYQKGVEAREGIEF
ncbi:cob(I)yrinic acid a,c-diamide adenosyltransferase [Kosmotoga pacifica]|uniref:Cobinamide adenolsyltransferase n=1 Tax=Kosmotoga pacifica TaxID=1330330 RepID=A0A0G2ZFT8_9BACT|nr:cob(I)yrinic acid a,c-diamide adenosyltransferase [Kosmotoga pacifica]AKI97663.1 cobinamide adenolsyltransferase [Kosmotoga pacifica]